MNNIKHGQKSSINVLINTMRKRQMCCSRKTAYSSMSRERQQFNDIGVDMSENANNRNGVTSGDATQGNTRILEAKV